MSRVIRLSIHLNMLDQILNSFFEEFKKVLDQFNKNKIFLELKHYTKMNTTCYFFHSFLSGSVVVLQNLLMGIDEFVVSLKCVKDASRT